MQAGAEVTIGITAYNEEANVDWLLRNLSAQAGCRPWEILVVSDCSIDLTDKIVKEASLRDCRIRLVTHAKRLGRASAINTLLCESNGQVIVLVSADTQPANGSIDTLLGVLLGDGRVGLVWAKPRPVHVESGIVGRIGRLSFRLHARLMSRLDQIDRLKHSTGELLAIRRGIVKQLPADCVNDDEYLGLATARRGFKVRFVPDVQVRFVLPTTLIEYIRQRSKWVYGHLQIKRIAGEYPTVMEFTAARNPRLVVGVVAEELKGRPQDLFVILVALLLELVVVGCALRDTVAARNPLTWKTAESTKRFPS
jgi:cellulose synthase/poly-beta-1,6-N-acetylglucosamine synthase-like glycosyltransferase